MSFQKSNFTRDPKYKRWVASKPCTISGYWDETVVPHHIENGGMGKKCADLGKLVPLRFPYHSYNASNYSVHKLGTKEFEKRFEVELNYKTLKQIAKELLEEYRNGKV